MTQFVPANPPAAKFGRILLTGATGGLGRMLRERIKPWAEVIRLSDVAEMGEAHEGEEIMRCDLADKAAVLALMEGVDAVLHFGGISTEAPFEAIMQANILGVANLYEAAHKAGVKRMVFASSNHTVGFYRTDEKLDAAMPVRPDSMYGVSKCFGETLSRYYWDRCGIETVCVRIGSSFPEPTNRRMLSTFFSYDDLVEMLRCALFAPEVGHTIVFGVSDNPRKWWDNRLASHLGYQPKDNAERLAPQFLPELAAPTPDDPANYYQGGKFVLDGPLYD